MSRINENHRWIERRRGKKMSVRSKTRQRGYENPFVSLVFDQFLSEVIDEAPVSPHEEAAVLAHIVEEHGDEIRTEITEANPDDLIETAETVESRGDEIQGVPGSL